MAFTPFGVYMIFDVTMGWALMGRFVIWAFEFVRIITKSVRTSKWMQPFAKSNNKRIYSNDFEEIKFS